MIYLQVFVKPGRATEHKTIMQAHNKGTKTNINYNCTSDYIGIMSIVHACNNQKNRQYTMQNSAQYTGGQIYLPLIMNYAMWASVLLRGGLTLLNLTAFYDVVSGQSSSKVIGMFFAASSSSSYSFVKASSFFSSTDISIIFTIIKPPFKFSSHSCRNQSRHICP